MTLAYPCRSSLFLLIFALAASCSSSSKKSGPDAQPDVFPAADAGAVSPPDSIGLDASSEFQGEAGQASPLTVLPPSIDLGIVQPAVLSPRQTITVTATRDIADLSVLLLGNDLTVDGTSTCGTTLAAGTSCLVVITFLSPTTGTKSDSIAIFAGGQSTVVPVTAKVQAGPHLVITPAAASLSPGMTITLNIGNTGDTGVGPLTVTITGTYAADFTATATGCDFLAPSGFCTIAVVFTQSACVAEAASLVVTGPAPDFATATVSLSSAHSLPNPPSLTSPTSALGSAPVGSIGPSVTFTLSYRGGSCVAPAIGPLTVTLSNAEFVVTDDTCSTSVLPLGGTCSLSVAVRPTSAGAKSANLILTEPSGRYEAGASLTGNGTAVIDAGPGEHMDSGVEQGEAGHATLDGSSG